MSERASSSMRLARRRGGGCGQLLVMVMVIGSYYIRSFVVLKISKSNFFTSNPVKCFFCGNVIILVALAWFYLLLHCNQFSMAQA